MRPRPPRSVAHRDGFSLVEVALSLAIVGFAVSAMLGTWPSGQQQFRSAADATLAAQLAQRLAAEAQQADFPDMLTLSGIGDGKTTGSLPRRHFSQAGREVAQADPERIYEVLTKVSHAEQLPVQSTEKQQRVEVLFHLTIIELIFGGNIH